MAQFQQRQTFTAAVCHHPLLSTFILEYGPLLACYWMWRDFFRRIPNMTSLTLSAASFCRLLLANPCSSRPGGASTLLLTPFLASSSICTEEAAKVRQSQSRVWDAAEQKGETMMTSILTTAFFCFCFFKISQFFKDSHIRFRDDK